MEDTYAVSKRWKTRASCCAPRLPLSLCRAAMARHRKASSLFDELMDHARVCLVLFAPNAGMDSIEKASPAPDDGADHNLPPSRPEPSSATAVAFTEPPAGKDLPPAQQVAPPPLAASPAPATPVEVPFDFQIFLDQMKTKSAEPVSKYLRRSVRP